MLPGRGRGLGLITHRGNPMTDFFTMQPGETAAPVPPGPVLCTGTAGMRRIHRVFLWAYGEAPGLVRSAAAGDTARAAYVGEVLGNFDKLLHIHHESEDLLMYPQLAERAPRVRPARRADAGAAPAGDPTAGSNRAASSALDGNGGRRDRPGTGRALR